jgi:phenylpyruvate tautomerase PptA (4-oxalocrotonate tautomerase family)
MQGIVRAVNRKTGIVVLEVTSRDYIVIEVPHCDFEFGDLITGEFDSVGSKIIRNDTKEELIHVYIQEVHTTPERAKQLVA